MEGSRVRVPAVLARVVRSFAGSRVERELLAQAFALVRPLARAGELTRQVAPRVVRNRPRRLPSNEKGA